MSTRMPETPTAEAKREPPEISIVVPTYNERENIPELVRRLDTTLAGIAWEIIVVDDSSPDGTTELAKQMARSDPRVRCLRRVRRYGLAGACIDGLLASSADYVAVMDADLQHDEGVLPALLAVVKRGDADIAIASRYVGTGSTGTGFSEGRAFASRAANRVARLALGTDVEDLMSGFFLLRRDLLDSVAPSLSPDGFKILADIVGSVPPGTRTVEIPYRFRERRAGTSKLGGKVIVDFFSLLISKASGGILPTTFVSFSLIGLLGVGVHLATLYALLALGSSFERGQAIAAIVAMTANFFINNQVTYGRLRKRTLSEMAYGLLLFWAVCSIGALANFSLAVWIYSSIPLWWFAASCGIVVASVWNYALSGQFVWRPQR